MSLYPALRSYLVFGQRASGPTSLWCTATTAPHPQAGRACFRMLHQLSRVYQHASCLKQAGTIFSSKGMASDLQGLK